MKKVVFVVIFLSSISLLTAQKKVANQQFKINAFLPGIGYEFSVGNNATLNFAISTSFGVRGCSNCNTEFGVYPVFSGQYNYYYNFERRKEKGKNISGNSGNYIAAKAILQDGRAIIGDLDLISDTTLVVGSVYGFQRTYKKGFSFVFETGLGYYEDDFNKGLAVLLDIKLGWVIRKKR